MKMILKNQNFQFKIKNKFFIKNTFETQCQNKIFFNMCNTRRRTKGKEMIAQKIMQGDACARIMIRDEK